MSKYTNIYAKERRHNKLPIMWVIRALVYVSVFLVSNGKDICTPWQ